MKKLVASILYKKIGLDGRLQPLNKKLDKKMFYDYTGLNKKEQQLIKKSVERIELTYLLTASTINIQPLINEEYHYENVMFVTVCLREEVTDKEVKILEEFIHGIIPHPVILVILLKSKIRISSCIKRLNRANKNSVVLGKINNTN